MGQASLFAPALNPNAQPIDFGFGRTPKPAGYAFQEPSSESEDNPPVQAFENTGWTPQYETPNPDFDAQQPMPELLSAAELSSDASLEMVRPLLAQPAASGAGPSYLEETFENYSAENYTPSLAPEQGSPSRGHEAWEKSDDQQTGHQAHQPQTDDWNHAFDPQAWAPESPAGVSEVAYPSLPDPSSDSSFDPLTPQADWAIASESPLAPSLDAGLGDLMPWEQLPESQAIPVPPSPEALWEQFDSGAALPGEQVPIESGAFLDSVHDKLYPEDPFTPDYNELVQGQQAFEEAAQFLFPDTMGAPLDWQAETSLSDGFDPFTAQALSLENSALTEPPLELGPSIQSDVSEVSDMTPYAVAAWQSMAPSPPLTPAAAESETALPFDTFDPFAIPPSASSGTEGFEGPATPMGSSMPFPTEASFDPLSPDALAFDPFSVSLPGVAEPPVVSPDAFEGFDSAFELSASEFAPPSPMPVDTWPVDAWDSHPREQGEALGPSLMDSTALEFDPFSPLSPESGDWETPAGVPDVPVVSADEDGILWPSETAADEAAAELSLEPSFPGADNGHLVSPEMGLPLAAWDTVDEAFANDLSGLPAVESLEAPVLPDLPDLSDQDFYATDFTLNAFGELVPVEPEEAGAFLPAGPAESVMPTPLEASPVDLALPLSSEAVEFIEAPLAQDANGLGVSSEPVFGAEPDASSYALPDAPRDAIGASLQASESFRSEAVSPFQRVALPPIPEPNGSVSMPPEAQPMEEALSPEQAFSGPLEAQWHDTSSEVTASAIQPSQVAPPKEFSLSDIQILSVCPLFADRRLLVVSSNEIYALMGQVGLQQPQVAVLKLFDHNPLAYQNTFTAVAEAHADSQGMFVTQVGTWRGIISTFQDKITLHTDLG